MLILNMKPLMSSDKNPQETPKPNPKACSRRQFISQTGKAGAAVSMAGGTSGWLHSNAFAQSAGERPERDKQSGIEVDLPCGEVPMSFIIDDSTPLVNLAHFAIPQFAEVFPNNYKQDWRSLPREIPDSFVREFAGWCRDHGVKGKYSVVPYPACVGWIDRDLPGWTKRELEASLRLIREELPQDWDFHPEMVSHTWVINTKTGRPYEERSQYFMENWRWTDGKSVDELANYLSYALQLLKNVDLPCEGITTPGGFGNRVLPQLSKASLESVRSVFQAEIPHYFRHLYVDERSVAPRVENVTGLDTNDPNCVVSIIGCTGDWFGGWDGLTPGSVDKLITADLQGGRLPEILRRGEPAIMVCHWPGIYYNGEKLGFRIFQEAVRRVERSEWNVKWMKLSEIARYWAAKELTQITLYPVDTSSQSFQVHLKAPYGCPEFTLKLPEYLSGKINSRPGSILMGSKDITPTLMRRISSDQPLNSGTWKVDGGVARVCFDLPKGESGLFFKI